MTGTCTRAGRRRAQHGAAAVELALVLPVLLLLMWGLVTFGTVFYSQMAISRAAAEGARAVDLAGGGVQARVAARDEVVEALAFSLIAPGVSGQAARRQWVTQTAALQISVDDGACDAGPAVGGTTRVRVEVPYASIRLLPPVRLPFVGAMDGWMPEALTGCAIAQV